MINYSIKDLFKREHGLESLFGTNFIWIKISPFFFIIDLIISNSIHHSGTITFYQPNLGLVIAASFLNPLTVLWPDNSCNSGITRTFI